MDRRSVAALSARSTFQRGLELPDRRIARPVDGIERQARARFEAVALDLEPAQAGIEALGNHRRWLRGAAVAFPANRPRIGLGAIRFTGGLLGALAGVFSVDLRGPDPAAPDELSQFWCRGGHYSAARQAGNIIVGNRRLWWLDGGIATTDDFEMTRVRSKPVLLTATAPVELEPGIVMQPGTYPGECKELGVRTIGGKTRWTPPEYSIEFTGRQLATMGMKKTEGLISIDWDVTPFVKLKQITVA
jgi:hypothetical protein